MAPALAQADQAATIAAETINANLQTMLTQD